MTLTNDIDYKNHVFEFPELSRIVGEPSTATLITLLNEVKSNAMSVHSDLGGGANGHLGLVVSPATYQTLVPGAPAYVRTTNPGRYTITGRETQPQITQRRAEHAEQVRAFKEVLGVERALLQQIVSAIEPKYLKALRLPTTNKLNATIPDIFIHLFTNYGDISPSELRTLTDQVQNMQYQPTEPVDTIFTEIDDLATISEMADAPLTEAQKINMAYLLFQQTQSFNRGLTSWNSRPPQDHTWNNFKQHFRQAQLDLRRTGALTVGGTINHAELMDLVSQGVHNALHSQPAPPSAPMDAPVHVPPMMETMPEPPHDDASLPELASANSATSTMTQNSASIIAMTKQMELMQNMILQMQQSIMASQPVPTNNNSSRRSPRASSTPAQNNNFRNANQTKYCHTHGACNHHSADCRSKGPNHQDAATFSNRMSGSTRNIN